MSDPQADVARRSPGALLKARRRTLRKQSRALAQQLKHSAREPGGAPPAAAIEQLRASLEQTRHELRAAGGGHDARLVIGALRDLDTSLAALASASRAGGDPAAAMRALAHGARALADARRKAKAAGHDWTL